jgi:deoxyribonuclease V
MPVTLDGRVVGHAVRTQEGVRPVWVSPGHLVGVDVSVAVVLQLARKFRVPEPLRHADRAARARARGERGPSCKDFGPLPCRSPLSDEKSAAQRRF